jgi:hypothetical protein
MIANEYIHVSAYLGASALVLFKQTARLRGLCHRLKRSDLATGDSD